MATWARRASALAAAVCLTVGLAACQEHDEGHSPEPGDGGVTTEPTDEPTAGTDDARVDAAVADLAERLQVAPEDITAGPLDEVTWTDGSLGCPAEGQMYTQALVPGTRLILTIDGTEYAYHGEGEEPLFYCANPIDPAPSDDATA